MKKLAEGKTKVVSEAEESRVVLLSKDDISAGDGTRRDAIEGKGAIATKTTANVFSLLNRCGIETHFVKQVDDVRMLCQRCEMIPLEVTIRGTAAGHYLLRNPGSIEGADLVEELVEFTFKDDACHDPLVLMAEEGAWRLHDSDKPVSGDTLIGGLNSLLSAEETMAIKKTAKDVFRVLREAWGRLGVKLIDLKIEFGRTLDGRIVVADVIDNDSWRLWPDGEKSRQLDKQVYREGGDLADVLDKYQYVMGLTEGFVEETSHGA